MKKVLAMFSTLCVAGSLAALDMSVGVMADYNLRGASVKISTPVGDTRLSASQSAIGARAFFDIKYAAIFVGGVFDVGNEKISSDEYSGDIDRQIQYLNVGLIGKYPFSAGNSAKIFPLIGIEYDMALSGKAMGQKIEDFREHKNDENDHLWLDLGVGSDISISERFIIRPQAMFGLQFNKPKNLPAKAKAFAYKIDVGIGIGLKF